MNHDASRGASRLMGPEPSLKQVLGAALKSPPYMFGIRLKGLVVIDCDVDNPALVQELEARFGPSNVHVKTPRGMHLYYSFTGGKLPNLRGQGLPVDLKTGQNDYVVAPPSVRPDGGIYRTAKGRLGVDALTPFALPNSARPAPRLRQGIAVGDRHLFLKREAIKMVPCVDNLPELFTNLAAVRDDQFDDPSSFPDDEVQKLAEWAWICRLENRLFAARDSAFQVMRSALDAIKGFSNYDDATALYINLVDAHGHTPGKVFPLHYEAMKSAGYTKQSRERFLASRRTLEQAGLLALSGKHKVGVSPKTFRLTRPLPSAIPTTNSHPE